MSLFDTGHVEAIKRFLGCGPIPPPMRSLRSTKRCGSTRAFIEPCSHSFCQRLGCMSLFVPILISIMSVFLQSYQHTADEIFRLAQAQTNADKLFELFPLHPFLRSIISCHNSVDIFRAGLISAHDAWFYKFKFCFSPQFQFKWCFLTFLAAPSHFLEPSLPRVPVCHFCSWTTTKTLYLPEFLRKKDFWACWLLSIILCKFKALKVIVGHYLIPVI